MLLDFQKTQREFTDRIRLGDTKPLPEGISLERMKVYEDGFLRTMDENVSLCFTQFKRVVGENTWNLLVRDFYSHYPLHTPFIYEIPQEFLTYLLKNPKVSLSAFQKELAHFEWMILVIELVEREISSHENTKNNILQISSAAELVGYHYAVHRVSEEFEQEAELEKETLLCLYRNEEKDIYWMELSAVEAKIFQCLKEQPRSAEEVFSILEKEIPEARKNDFLEEGKNFFKKLQELSIITHYFE